MNNIITIISFIAITTISCRQITNKETHPLTKTPDRDVAVNEFVPGHYKDIVKDSTMTTLKELGIIAKPAVYILQSISNLKFNNDIIHINLYATFNIIDNIGQIDSLMFVYNGIEHIIRLRDDIYLLSPHCLLRSDLIEVKDYNFDGFADISIYDYFMSGVKNKFRSVYLYNPEKKNYFYHRELSEMSSLSINNNTKTISSWSEGGMASQIFWSGEYKWEKGSIVLFHSVEQDYIAEPLNSFIRKTSKLQHGTWIIQTDTLSSFDDM